MPFIKIDPFEEMRKNAHIWRGTRSVLWYTEELDDSMHLMVFYDFGDKKRALVLKIGHNNRVVEFRNNDVDSGEFESLKKEIEFMEALLREPQKKKSKNQN